MALYTGLMQARKAHCFCLGPSRHYLHRKRQLCCEAQERKWTNLFPLGASQSRARPQGTVTSCWWKRTRREVSHGTRKGLAFLPRGLPCPRHNVSASRASPTARIPTTKAKRHWDPRPAPLVLSKIVSIYRGGWGWEDGLGCPELCLKIEMGGGGGESRGPGPGNPCS